MIVDTHLHVWSSDYNTYPMEGGRTSNENGSVEFLNTRMAEAGVDKAVIVQPIHYLFDNSYVSDTLKRFPGKFAAIGLVNQFEPGASDRLETLVTEHGFSGLRIHLSRPDHTSMWAGTRSGPYLGQGRQARSELHIARPVLSLLGHRADHRAAPRRPHRTRPHGGAPRIEDPPYPGMRPVLDLAKYPNVYVKLIPHKEQEPFPYKDSHDAFKRIYDAFGPQRLMVGDELPRCRTGDEVRPRPRECP